MIEGNLVRIYGNFECVGKNSKNSYNIKNSGPCTVEFLDTKQKVRFQLPDVVMSGILLGTMQLYLHNSMIFHDKENELKAHVTFDSNNTDKLKGSIYKFNKPKLQLDASIPINKVKDISYEICSIKGNWQSSMFFDETKVWDIEQVISAEKANSSKDKSKVLQCVPMPVPNSLPSDSRYREDLIWLKK